MDPPSSSRKYTPEEKRQLVANLDIEVAHRTRQFEAWLNDRLENFTIHQEGQVLRIPKQVRAMTMREFGEKYQGNVQAALRGYQKEKLAAAGGDTSLGEIDKSMRKRKWAAAQDLEGEPSESQQPPDSQPWKDESRSTKFARTNLPSPKKVAGSSTGPGTAQAQLTAATQKTPRTTRVIGRAQPSPSPQKPKPPFNSSMSSHQPRIPSRPFSPMKNLSSKPPSSGLRRVPSRSSFNPVVPAKAPAYPTGGEHVATMRLPRKDESMLSMNGSPLANPYEFGLGWFKGIEMEDQDDDNDGTQPSQTGTQRNVKRSKSSIIIRRDPVASGLHSRTDSQASFYTASSQTASTNHSRDNSQSDKLILPDPPLPSTFRFPSSNPLLSSTRQLNSEATPRPIPKHARSFSALVAIPTKDGHVIEFDPLQTSPSALDALEGITDSAKKQARVEMGKLVQAAVDKWKV